MNINPQTRTQTSWDDEIDLRQLIEALLRRKWMIASWIALSVALAAVFSYFILPPKYESSVVVALPSALDSDRFGMNVQAYEAFATSNAVWRAMIQSGKLDMGTEQVRQRLLVQLDANARLLNVTAKAPTAMEAEHLANLWHTSFQSMLSTHAEAFVGDRLRSAEDNLSTAQVAVSSASKRVDEFEREQSITLKEARLKRWEEELIDAEAQRDELAQQLIPEDTGRVVILEELLSSMQPTLDTGAGLTVVPDPSGQASVGSGAVTILNPDYLDLSRELSQTRTRLATNELKAGRLEERIVELPVQIELLRLELADLRAVQVSLLNESTVAQQVYQDVLRDYQGLSHTYKGLGLSSSATVIAEPSLPTSPVAPRKLLNMALAAVLGGFIGVGIAFFQHFWQAGRA